MVRATLVPTNPVQIQTRRQKLLTCDVTSPPTPHRIELRNDPAEELITSKKPLIISQQPAPKAKRKLIGSNLFNGTNNDVINKDNQKNTQHKLTEYFPVRRSARKTKTTVLEEKQLALERLVKNKVEDGLEVRFFEEKGRGVVAAKEFYKGDYVVEYVGELVDTMEAKEREAVYAENENAGCYMYYFKHNGQQYCIDATAETNRLGRLVNHSRNGNLMTKVIMVDGKPRLVLLANRHIKIGEEVLYDYGDRSRESLKHHPWLAY